MTKLATVLTTLLLSFILAACGGDNKNKGSNTNNNLLVQPTACPDLNDSSYRSDTLHSGDFIPSGFKQHWYLTFENNQAQFIESDFVIFADEVENANIPLVAEQRPPPKRSATSRFTRASRSENPSPASSGKPTPIVATDLPSTTSNLIEPPPLPSIACKASAESEPKSSRSRSIVPVGR